MRSTADERSQWELAPVQSLHRCPIRHMLVCLDLSRASESSIGPAAALARVSAARVTLLNVIESGLEPGDRPPDPLARELDRRAAFEFLSRARKQFEKSDIETAIRVVEGHPAQQIIAETRGLDVDLTVLARHGQHGVSQWPLGSTAQKVLTRGTGSVLLIPEVESGRPGWHSPPRRVLVLLDCSSRAESALGHAETIAEANQAELILMHIVGEPRGGRSLLLGEDDARLTRELRDRWERSAHRYLTQLRTRVQARHRSVRQVIERESDIRQGLVDGVRRERTDLVVLSAHGDTCNPDRPFGSVAEHFIHHCDLPLLLVQDAHEEMGHRRPPARSPGALADGRLPRL